MSDRGAQVRRNGVQVNRRPKAERRGSARDRGMVERG
jgi:hypothetical protein